MSPPRIIQLPMPDSKPSLNSVERGATDDGADGATDDGADEATEGGAKGAPVRPALETPAAAEAGTSWSR